MLALLSAPRGRVSAARVAARVRERTRAQANRAVVRLPRAVAAPATPEYHPRMLSAAAEAPARAIARPPSP